MPVEFEFPVSPDGVPFVPITGGRAAGGEPLPSTDELGTGARSVGSGASFLGNGLIRPFRRDKQLDFKSASGIELLKSCVGQVLGTSLGEIQWRTNFGSRFEMLRHRNNDPTTRELARVWAAEALSQWEPRIRVTGASVRKVDVPPNGKVGIAVTIRFDVIERNVPGNRVATGLDVDVLI